MNEISAQILGNMPIKPIALIIIPEFCKNFNVLLLG